MRSLTGTNENAIFFIGDGSLTNHNPQARLKMRNWGSCESRLPVFPGAGRIRNLRRDFTLHTTDGAVSFRDRATSTVDGKSIPGFKSYRTVWAFGLWILKR